MAGVGSTGGINNINNASSSRITGLFSTLDTDTLVKNLCATQQSKIDRQQQKKTRYEWFLNAVNEVRDKIKEFQNTYCSALGASSMLKSSTYYSYNITSLSTSNAVTLSGRSNALEGTYTVKVLQLASNSSAKSSGTVSKNGTEISSSNTATLDSLSFENDLVFDESGKIKFEINGEGFEFSKDTTLQTMINTINNSSTANVTMRYSRITDSFIIEADEGGANSSVTIRNISGNAFGENSAFKINEGTYKNGTDSITEINGVTIQRNSNSFEIDGISFTLNAVTKDTPEETLTFTVKRDYSATVKAITDFVKAYNDLITYLNKLSTEKDYSRDYPPLTPAQEDELTEKQIEKWNEKAKSGILSRDLNLDRLIRDLKSSFFTPAGGTGLAATSIGLAGGVYKTSDSGLIVVDEDALTRALEKRPETVISIFTGGSSSASSDKQGIIYKIRSAIAAYNDATSESLKKTENNINDLSEEISELEDKLNSLAERYYNKFATMETALAKLNSQAAYISMLFTR